MGPTTRSLLYALAAVVLICFTVYLIRHRPSWGHLGYWRARLSESSRKVYRRSGGTFDEAAALALRRIENTLGPKGPADHHLAASIIRHNILEQEPGRGVTARLRHELAEHARRHYIASLLGLTPRAVAQDTADRVVIRYGLVDDAPPPPPEEPGAEFLIDTAFQFANMNLGVLLGYDEGPALPQQRLANLAEDRLQTSIQMRRAAAAEVAAIVSDGAPGTFAESYLDLSQVDTNDLQNSHDVSVNAAKRAIVARLRDEQGSQQLPTLAQISQEISAAGGALSRHPTTGKPRPALVQKAVRVIERAKLQERSLATDATDEEVFRRVWVRADHPRNREKKALLRQAFFDALADSWEEGLYGETIQCVDGRISRMVASLSLLDYDEKNWRVHRLEQHKNNIFGLAKKLIKSSAEEAAEGDDRERQKVGKSYLATTAAQLQGLGELDETAEAQWTADTRARVEREIDQYIAKVNSDAPGTIPEYALDTIKKEALAALPTI